MISRDGCDLSFPDICLTVEEKLRKKVNQEIDPNGDRTRVRCVRGNEVIPELQTREAITYNFYMTHGRLAR